MKIILLGYMASGKTIIANKLSDKITLKHIDLDSYIEKKEGLTIPEIFKNKGEIAFRLMEHHYLKELLFDDSDFILSVGGGTPCYANNIELIKNHSFSIYLKANIDTLYNRIIKKKDNRPLVKDISNKDLKEFIAKHLFERNIFYDETNIKIDVNNKSVIQIVEEIKSIIDF